MELIARSPEAEYDWKVRVESVPCIMRPCMGRAGAMTVSTRSMRRSASRPRSDSARLIDRPRSAAVARGSGRRS